VYDRLPGLRLPVLVCAGRYDGIAPPANSEAIARQVPGADLALFEGGHLFMVQDRSAYPRMMEFLSRP
jgi:3-oxoadipate enol-lactonase